MISAGAEGASPVDKVAQASSPARAGSISPPRPNTPPGGTPDQRRAGEDARATIPRLRPFRFERDTFAFANELIWQYRFDPATGATITFRTQPPPAYAHRCFVMVRAARQFLYHARFEPGMPATETDACRSQIREIVSRSPRKPCPEAERVVVAGYGGLRSLSQTQGALLKNECGGAWRSYTLRSHWRMVFPVSRRQQERMARQLVRAFQENPAPIVHLFRFPQLTINHGLVLFGFAEADASIQFQAYDPNIPAHPVELVYHREDRTFYFARTHYWPGGKVNVIEVYRGWLY